VPSSQGSPPCSSLFSSQGLQGDALWGNERAAWFVTGALAKHVAFTACCKDARWCEHNSLPQPQYCPSMPGLHEVCYQLANGTYKSSGVGVRLKQPSNSPVSYLRVNGVLASEGLATVPFSVLGNQIDYELHSSMVSAMDTFAILGMSRMCNELRGTFTAAAGLRAVRTKGSTCVPNASWIDFEGNGCAAYRADTSMCDTVEARMLPDANRSTPAAFSAGPNAKQECCVCSSRGSMLQEDVDFFFGPKHPAIQADRPYKVCFSDAGITGPFVDTGIVMMAEDECVQLEVGGENINDGRYLTIPPIEDIVLGLVKGQFFENEFAPNDTISLISIAGTQFTCFTRTKAKEEEKYKY